MAPPVEDVEGERLMSGGNNSNSLSSSVLVLNRLYAAIHVVGVRRAFGLMYRELAEVVDFEEGIYSNYDFRSWLEISEIRADEREPNEDWLRAVNFEVLVPRVIRLLVYDRFPKRSIRLSRNGVFARDEHRCQYCDRRLPSAQLSLDHVIPRSRGGTTSWENVVCACLKCNVKKGGRTPREARMLLGRKPYRPSHNPLLTVKLTNPKYESWKTWLVAAHCEVGV